MPGSWMFSISILFRPVSTTMPPLPTELKPSRTISEVIRPGVRMAESAIWPRVRSVTVSMASSALAKAWVAPSSIAFSRLFSSGSMAIDVLGAGVARALHGVDADAADAHDHHGLAGPDLGGVDGRSPSRWGRRSRRARPCRAGRSSSTLTQEFWWITPYWLNVPSMHIAPYWPRGPGDREPLARQVALEDGRAHVADGLLAVGAVAAGAAVGDERADDVVADLDPRDARARPPR